MGERLRLGRRRSIPVRREPADRLCQNAGMRVGLVEDGDLCERAATTGWLLGPLGTS
jgi:hypothetical protein